MKRVMPRRIKLEIGNVLDKLTIIDIRYENGKYRYECLCACGNSEVYNKNPLRRSLLCNKCLAVEIGVKNRLLNNEAAKNRLYGKYKKRIENKKKEFCLTKTQFNTFISEECYYCASPPSIDSEKIIRNGIDRIDSNIGYLIDNCVSCCETCNRAKSDKSMIEFLQWIEKLTNKRCLNKL